MKQARFTVTLSKASTLPVTVAYATEDGTATAPTFYTAKTGTLTFAPGELKKSILIPVVDPLPAGTTTATFKVRITDPTNATISLAVGTITLGKDVKLWLDRFTFTYDLLLDNANGYFGPPTGTKAYQFPYHARERAIIVEAPDWTHESVSETVSFWVKMEAWKTILTGDVSGLDKAWQSIETHWIPNATGQPWGDYTPESPAAYVPDALRLEDTPMASSTDKTAGADPLYAGLAAAYGTKAVYLMHWLIDVDGDYGFKNPDGSRTGVFVNNYQRGPVEDGLATITHPCYDDFANGGNSTFGWQSIYGRSIDMYPDGDENLYSKQANYSMAGDADVRAVGNIHQAVALAESSSVSTALKAKASKMADYIRYTLYDKYFIGDAAGCHYLLSWGCGFGVGLPVEGAPASYWGFRIGNSEIHHGYNGIDVAYAARAGGDLNPLAEGAKEMWSVSLDRQLELLRWLQSPEGPIAGGVTSSWRGRYEVPTDGRQNATFHGLYYNHSPSWFNPPSNNWIGFQAWSLDRVAAVYVHAAMKSDEDNKSIAFRCGVILDKFIAWLMDVTQIDLAANTLEYPINTRWTSDTIISGQTATQPSAKYYGLPENPSIAGPDVYEYLPTKTWPGSSPDYASFWKNDGTVPNPNLHCVVTERGWDPGTASGFAQVLVQYCHAKKLIDGNLEGSIPSTAIKYTDVLQLGVDMLEFLWNNQTSHGFGSSGLMALTRLDDKLWIPSEFGTGYMPTGEIVANGVTTFASLRATMYQSTPEWPALRAWLDSDRTGPAPEITYHRFWNGSEAACGFGMLHKYFPDALATV